MSRRYLTYIRYIRTLGPEPDPNATPPTPPIPPSPPITYTKEQVEKMVAERVSKSAQLAAKREAELLEKMRDAETDKAAREALEAQLEDARSRTLTAEQQAADREKRVKEEAAKEVAAAKDEARKAFSQYAQSKIKRELTDAAVAEDAFRPNQVVALIHQGAKLVDVIDPETKKPTGEHEVRVMYQDPKDGKILSLPPRDAVKKMKEDVENHGNLFKSGVVGGLGAGAPQPKPPAGSHESLTPADIYEKLKKGELRRK